QQPQAIINAGAYTAVDKAESEPELAARINGEAVAVLADYSAHHSCPLIQVSTDFVFNGEQGHPYLVDQATDPVSVYGQTKLAGETAALTSPLGRVLRTSWVYSEHGHNFVKTILRLAAERDQLAIVADQIGSPTYAANLAAAVWQLLDLWPAQRRYHYSDAGVCSWYDFALAIVDESEALGLLNRRPELGPQRSEDYPTPAKRPHYSVMQTSNQALHLPAVHWRAALQTMLNRLSSQQ
ncbi:MAG: dTDP-4-dehydrorhamnose reductase, partial [Cellvibrionaceae bacterium]|nr:dTDP-4-dehydrorhamnose reductase [Cellvibrionaceae bacterium]